MKTPFRLLLLGLGLAALPVAPSLHAAPHPYADSTVAVYNSRAAGARELAEFYAAQRGLPEDRLIGLDCSEEETIGRAEYESAIAAPLREAFRSRGWWTGRATESGGFEVTGTKIHVLTLLRGLPLRISHDPAIRGGAPGPGTALEGATPQQAAQAATTAASIDSELALLGKPSASSAGWVANPYYRSALRIPDVSLPWLLVVGRIDGPSDELARRLITDAVETEATGLWGKAYIDLARKGPGYDEGDAWLTAAALRCWNEGMAVVLDQNPQTFPLAYPMTDAAVYLGWYAGNVNGPFRDPKFRFRKGAIACHLHSFSATTLRHPNQRWTAPLLARGAAASLGNVYEPFLSTTAHFDLFLQRLTEGFTVGEAAAISHPVLSWMGIAAGDPLYRPFRPQAEREQIPADDDRAVFLAHRDGIQRWGNDPAALAEKFTRASENLKTGYFLESLGLLARARGDQPAAASWFEQAGKAYAEPADRLRQTLLRADLFRELGNVEKAVELLRAAAPDYEKIPEGKCVTALLNILDPPPPPAPSPAGEPGKPPARK